MAEEKDIVVRLNIDTKNAESSTKSVEDNLKDIEDSLKDIGKSGATDGLIKQMEKLNNVVENQNLTWGEAGKTIEQYQNIALAAGSTSPIGQEAIRRAGELKQEVDTLTRSIDVAAQRGQGMQGALAIGSTVTAGYGALQGVMALAGEENEVLMQSLVKMQAAQSVLTGIEQIRLAVEKEGVLVTTLQNAKTKIATALTAAYATVVGTATGAMKIFKLALAATGIGAIVVGLGLLIANFGKVSEAVIKGAKWVQNMAKEFREMGAGMQVLIGSLSLGLVPAISYAIKLFEDLGVVDDVNTRKHKENINARIKDIKRETDTYVNAKKEELAAAQQRFNEEDAALNHQMALMQAAGKSTIEIERKVLQNKRDSISEQIALTEDILRTEIKAHLEILKLRSQTNDLVGGLLKSINDEIEKQGGQDAYINRLVGDNKELNELKDTLKKTENEIEIFEVKTNKIRSDAAKKNAEEKDKLRKEELEKDKKKLEDELKARQDAQQKAFELEQKRILDEEVVAEAYRQRQLTAQQKELDDLNEKLNNELLAIGNNEELKLLLEEEYLTKKNAIVNKYIDLEDEAKKKADDEELARKLALADKVNEKAQQGLDFASNLNAIFGKENEKAAKRDFQINKAKNLAEASTDGVKAVLSTFANTPTGIVGKSLAATAAGIFAASNIARIASSTYEGGGGGSSSTVSIPRVSSGGANGGATGQAQQNDNLTNIAQLLNNQPSPVLVVDSFNKVDSEASKIKTVSSI